MQTANILLAIAGDKGNTVQKIGATAAEVAVLRVLHGDDAVYDIDVTGDVVRTHRQEIARLTEQYGRQEGERRTSRVVESLYPGAAARVFETFEELEIPEEFYAVDRRKPAPAAAPAADDAEPLAFAEMTINELRAHAAKVGIDLTGINKKADIVEALELAAANAPAEVDEDDGTGPMNDGSTFD
jgi:hypothetical protein